MSWRGLSPVWGLRIGDGSVTVGCTPHILHIYRHASMTGVARYAAPTARDHATNSSVLVSSSLWAILSQRTIARRSSSGEGGGRPAAARHTCATGTSLIVWAHTVVAALTLYATAPP